jgi:DNA-nicking Smr family endonuclease
MPSPSDQLDLQGLSFTDAIERFVDQYNVRVKNGQCGCWTVVHGYGSSGEGGAIRSKLRGFLNQHPDKLRYEFGDNYGNPGST